MGLYYCGIEWLWLGDCVGCDFDVVCVGGGVECGYVVCF